MDTLRARAWYADWKAAVFKTIDQAFDGDASTVSLLGVTGEDDLDVALAALMSDLEAAYKAGEMGGGSFRQISPERLGPEALVKKLSKLEEEQMVVFAACPAAKRDAVLKKVAKYNAKAGSKILVAWAGKDGAAAAYPVNARE